MNQSLMKLRKSYIYSLLLLTALLTAFLLENLLFGPVIGGFAGNYVCPTIMWLLLIFFLFRLPGVRPAGKLRLGRLLRWLALMCVFIGILGAMIQGGMGGFGKSPYDHSLIGIVVNIVSLGMSLVAIEMSRAWLTNRHFFRTPRLYIPLLALGFTLFSVPLAKMTNIKSGLSLTKFIGMSFFPDLGQNLLATYLAFLGGPLPAIIYRGGLIVFERFSPILPNADWIHQTLLGTLAPVIGLIIIQQIYQEEARLVRGRPREDTNYLGWMMTSLAAILILWFSLGVFTYSPRVIVSGSMQPTINIGDIVIIKKISGEEAKVGDVIMFPLNNMKVTHRIVDIQSEEAVSQFITKGDAYLNPDSTPVPIDTVQGKVVMVIPKAGCLTLLLRGFG